MTFLKNKHARACRMVLFAALLFAALAALLCLSAGAELSCGHDVGVDNGFCMENECIGYEIPTLNGDTYEIANLGQLYWFNNVLLPGKPAADTVRVKLTGHIVINAELLDANGALNDAYFPDDEEAQGPVLRVWVPRNVSNVVFDGDGYTICGLYAVGDRVGMPIGLFGKAENVTVKNLGITESYFASADYAGAMIGEAVGGCTVENCFLVKSVLDCDKSAAFVGFCGYNGSANLLKKLCTDASGIVFECAAESTVEKCYYLADVELDELSGTTALADLAAAGELLSDESGAWGYSCVYHMPTLRDEHYYENACDIQCSAKSCGDNACEKNDCHTVCTHMREVGEEGRVPHEYDNACDAECNICHYLDSSNKQQHVYQNPCQTKCDACGAERTVTAAHHYDSKCDRYCNYCLAERTPEIENHEYEFECSEKCRYCGYKRTEFVAHLFDDKCDMVCNRCAVTRPGDHAYDHACDVDCNDCGFKRAIQHVFGPYTVITPATHFKEGTQERRCTVEGCGYQEITAIAELPGLPLWFVLTWLISGGIVFLLSGFALFWFVIKKRTFAHLIGRAPEQLKEKEKKRREQERLAQKEKKKEQAAEKSEEKPQSGEKDKTESADSEK